LRPRRSAISFFSVVLSWVAVDLLGTAAGWLASGQALATLLTALLAGRWADRLEHRPLMISVDLLRAVVLVLLVALWLGGGAPSATLLFLCVLVLAACQALFRPALQAALPELVQSQTLLPAANALLDTTERIARLLGPGLLGIAAALVPLVHFVTADALTFLVSALAVLATLRLRAGAEPQSRAPASLLASVLHGFRAARPASVAGVHAGSDGGDQ
jgi:MFS family permease